MRYLVIIFILNTFGAFAQIKDYKSYDKALEYNRKGNVKQAIKYANKALKDYSDWNKPNLLLASIYSNNDEIELAVMYLLRVYDEKKVDDISGMKQIARLYYTHGYYKEALYYFNLLKTFNKQELSFLVLQIIDLTKEVNKKRNHELYLTNLTHELKTPLSVIIGYLETINFEEFSLEENKKFIEIVNSVMPHQCTLVPDSTSQLTSDHGFDLKVTNEKKIFLT